MIRNTFWFLSGMAFALAWVMYLAFGPITLRRKPKPVEPEWIEPWGDL